MPPGTRRVMVSVPEWYVAGADTRGREEGRPYPRSQQVIHAIFGLERLIRTPFCWEEYRVNELCVSNVHLRYIYRFDGFQWPIAFNEKNYASCQINVRSSDKFWIFARDLYLWAINGIVGLAFLASVLNNEKTLAWDFGCSRKKEEQL